MRERIPVSLRSDSAGFEERSISAAALMVCREIENGNPTLNDREGPDPGVGDVVACARCPARTRGFPDGSPNTTADYDSNPERPYIRRQEQPALRTVECAHS